MWPPSLLPPHNKLAQTTVPVGSRPPTTTHRRHVRCYLLPWGFPICQRRVDYRRNGGVASISGHRAS
jgi:hypothetical protein